ncbi:hypothetical protein ABZT51_52540, partial [Streptomyces sp. NPDC005373]|uniref:hypothetical protein n=1 Tax=Streptomyces sp. NPDC005373 TaxID=3156879 RepID=UPI0033A5B615
MTPLLPLAIEVRIARRFAATLADTTLTPLVAAFLRLLRDVAANPPLGGRPASVLRRLVPHQPTFALSSVALRSATLRPVSMPR